MVNVSEAFLPPQSDLEPYLKTIWDTKTVTNNGPVVKEFEDRLKQHLGVKHLFFVANGTLAIQMALKALGKAGSVITSPYSAVPVLQGILWQNYQPVFSDVQATDFCMDPNLLPEEIPDDARAVLATHVYGCACNINAIDEYARRKKLLTIYDASQAFGSTYMNNDIMTYGDICVFSTHAFKILNTLEGGVIITPHDDIAELIYQMRFFGKNSANNVVVEGLNAKNTELNAAIGICNLKYTAQLLSSRKTMSLQYNALFAGLPVRTIEVPDYCGFNYSYYPILLNSEERCIELAAALKKEQIGTRRLFHPSLNTILSVAGRQKMPVSESLASRVLCLPLHNSVTIDIQSRVADIISQIV